MHRNQLLFTTRVTKEFVFTIRAMLDLWRLQYNFLFHKAYSTNTIFDIEIAVKGRKDKMNLFLKQCDAE